MGIGVGQYHTCAVLVDGSIACWGDNSRAELGDGTTAERSTVYVALPPGSATQVVAGAVFTCALMTDQTVSCWGGPSGPMTPTPVTGVTGAVQIASGHRFACARDASGGVSCWGANNAGQLGRGTLDANNDPPALVSGITDATDIVGGSRFACARHANGSYSCWGNNDNGELGLGSYSNPKLTPVALPVNNIAQLALSTRHACARLVDGTVQCWGGNSRGELGTGDFFTSAQPASTVLGITNAVYLASGGRHACARVADGSVLCWGQNDFGQLGTGDRAASATPVSAMVPAGASEVVSGADRTCTVYPTGDLWCWSKGNLGNGTDGWAGVPIQASVQASDVGNGNDHACVIDKTAMVQCWGYNSYGELGDGTTNDHYSPAPVTLGGPVSRLSVGFLHSCAIVASKVWCWGRNDNGQIGDNTTTTRPTPVQLTLSGSSSAAQVSAGFIFTCAITTGGEVQCWGDNKYGNLGDGTTTARLVPTKVPALSGATNIATGWFNSCAIAGGVLSCWGNNAFGQLGIGSYTEQHTPQPVTLPNTPIAVATGEHHTCALLSNNQVWCWGNNDLGQLGKPGIAGSTTPTQVPGVLATSLTVGADHTCVVTTGGDTKCWGENSLGELGDGGAIVDTSARAAMFSCQ